MVVASRPASAVAATTSGQLISGIATTSWLADDPTRPNSGCTKARLQLGPSGGVPASFHDQQGMARAGLVPAGSTWWVPRIAVPKEYRMSFGYGNLSTEVYDLDKPVGTSFGEVEYYAQLLTGIHGRVLEPAVGTGRVLIPLLQAGFDVDGYDTSPEMLAVCHERCRERGLEPSIREADMTTFIAPGEYAAVIVPSGSITLLDGREQTTRALESFRACLQPSGRLAIDVGAPQLVTESESMRSWAAGSLLWTLQTLHIEYDSVANQTTRWLRYDKWDDGSLLASELQIFRLQHWSVNEFTTLLSEAGFADISVTSEYDLDRSPDSESGMWTFHASRL
jgi:SAM-dependent methyltransferase